MEEREIVLRCIILHEYSSLKSLDFESAKAAMVIALTYRGLKKWPFIYHLIGIFPKISLIDAMLVAFKEGCLSAVGQIIHIGRDDPILCNEALLQSLYYRSNEIVTLLLEQYQVNINYISELYEFGEERSSAWLIVIHQNHLGFTKLLTENSADLDLCLDLNGQKALDIASTKSPMIAKYLNDYCSRECPQRKKGIVSEVSEPVR